MGQGKKFSENVRYIYRKQLEEAELIDLQVRSVSVGQDAQGRVTVTCGLGGRVVRGHGVSTDIVEACGRAVVDAINRLEAASVTRSEEARA